MPYFDKNERLVCPNCHKSDGVVLEWSDGDNIRGEHEDVFMCDLCKCVFVAEYKVDKVFIIGEEEND